MKLTALLASAALAFSPLGALANDTTANNAGTATVVPAAGGVAKSSIDLSEGDSELLTLVIIAGAGVVVAGTLIALGTGGDDAPAATVTTATGTN